MTATDKSDQDIVDGVYNINYKYLVIQAAQHKYDFWLNSEWSDLYAGDPSVPTPITVGHNHEEIFGTERFEVHVEREFERIRAEEYSKEQIAEYEKQRKEKFFEKYKLNKTR